MITAWLTTGKPAKERDADFERDCERFFLELELLDFLFNSSAIIFYSYTNKLRCDRLYKRIRENEKQFIKL